MQEENAVIKILSNLNLNSGGPMETIVTRFMIY
jgi:hypothetical protein